ncbi:MAG: biotin/lipoyl-binding protein, partial [Anaerolineae bacterium]
MKRYTRPLLALLIVVLVAGGGYWFYQNQLASTASTGTSATYTQIVQVKQGSLNSTLSVVGELDAVQSEDLAFTHVNGTDKLVKLNVAAGNTVAKGQVLATIDPAAYQQALDQAKSDLQAAQQKLTDLKAAATPLQVAQSDLAIAQAKYQLQVAQSALDDLVHPDMVQLQANVAAAQTALAQAQVDLLAKQLDTATKDQLSRLYQAEATPAAEYNRLAAETYSDESYQDRLTVAYNKMMDAQDARVTYETQQQASLVSAQKQVRTAQQALADAQKALATAQAGGDKLALANAQLAVQTAQVALAKAQDDRVTLNAGTDAATLAAAQADVDKKGLALADAQAALTGAQLTASFDGTVLQTNVKPGDGLTASTV